MILSARFRQNGPTEIGEDLLFEIKMTYEMYKNEIICSLEAPRAPMPQAPLYLNL